MSNTVFAAPSAPDCQPLGHKPDGRTIGRETNTLAVLGALGSVGLFSGARVHVDMADVEVSVRMTGLQVIEHLHSLWSEGLIEFDLNAARRMRFSARLAPGVRLADEISTSALLAFRAILNSGREVL